MNPPETLAEKLIRQSECDSRVAVKKTGRGLVDVPIVASMTARTEENTFGRLSVTREVAEVLAALARDGTPVELSVALRHTDAGLKLERCTLNATRR